MNYHATVFLNVLISSVISYSSYFVTEEKYIYFFVIIFCYIIPAISNIMAVLLYRQINYKHIIAVQTIMTSSYFFILTYIMATYFEMKSKIVKIPVFVAEVPRFFNSSIPYYIEKQYILSGEYNSGYPYLRVFILFLVVIQFIIFSSWLEETHNAPIYPPDDPYRFLGIYLIWNTLLIIQYSGTISYFSHFKIIISVFIVIGIFLIYIPRLDSGSFKFIRLILISSFHYAILFLIYYRYHIFSPRMVNKMGSLNFINLILDIILSAIILTVI